MGVETWAKILLISSRIPDATLVRGYEVARSRTPGQSR